MKLKDLEKYNTITIQCHDNPDADSIASGYAIYTYFKEKGKDVSLIYSGKNKVTKSNLRLMLKELNIPLEYLKAEDGLIRLKGLLITVDCQYGAGNVSRIQAEEVAVIDHHQVENDSIRKSVILPRVGSCSTVVWKMMKDEGYDFEGKENLGTALYYGLYTDTNQLTEIENPLDKDMMEEVNYDDNLIMLLRNSNLSLRELEIAGVAMLRYSFNEEYEFAVIKAQECDPNILGLISDFLLQVDQIKTCVVFNETAGGFKMSVRSCIREVNASELATFLTEGVGSGGGHRDKAGGFISASLFEKKYKGLHSEGYFNNRMMEYFDSYDVIYAKNYEANIDEMEFYEKRNLPIGYVNISEVLPVGTPVTIRTLEGDIDIVVEDDLIVMIGISGEVYPNRREKFERSYVKLEGEYSYAKYTDKEYIPTIKMSNTGKSLPLVKYAKLCQSSGVVRIYVKPLEKTTKIFTEWDKEKYLLGHEGDMLAVRNDDLHDVYIIEKNIFGRSYSKIEE